MGVLRRMVLVAKLADAPDCGSGERNLVWVQVPSFTLLSLCGLAVYDIALSRLRYEFDSRQSDYGPVV